MISKRDKKSTLVSKKIHSGKLEKVQEAYLRGEYTLSIERAEELIKAQEKDIRMDALYIMGLSYLRNAQYERARRVLKRLLSQTPPASLREDAYLILADSFLLEDKINTAISRYKEMALDFPETLLMSLIYMRLGECYQKKAKWQEAKEYFHKVKHLYPRTIEAEEAERILKDYPVFFTIQVGAFREKENAQSLLRGLKRDGFNAYIEEFKKDGQGIYRVRVGRWDTRSEARYIEGKLKKKGFPTKVYP